MSQISFYLVLLLAAIVSGEKKFRFDYKYYPAADGWLKLHRVPANWAEARLRCDLEGAVLASPLNAKLLSALKQVIANQVHCGVFSGISATISKGDYLSVEGVPLSKIPVTWAPNEPDNFEDSESCLMMLANGTMADIKCSEVFPYVCYKKDVSIAVGTCGIIGNEYHLDSRTGSCYKFHRIGQTWPRAHMTCVAEEGYLAIINTDIESKVLTELYSKFPDKIILSLHKGAVFVGYHDCDKNGTWRTVHGETLQAAGYDKWRPGEPNNMGSIEYCGTMFPTGLLNDNSCSLNLPFICEKSPPSMTSNSSDSH